MDFTFIAFCLSIGCITGSYLIHWRIENLLLETEVNLARLIADLSTNDKAIADAINDLNKSLKTKSRTKQEQITPQ